MPWPYKKAYFDAKEILSNLFYDFGSHFAGCPDKEKIIQGVPDNYLLKIAQ